MTTVEPQPRIELHNHYVDAVVAPYIDPVALNGTPSADALTNLAKWFFTPHRGWDFTGRARGYTTLPSWAKIHQNFEFLRVKPITDIPVQDSTGEIVDQHPRWWAVRRMTPTSLGPNIYSALPNSLLTAARDQGLDILDWTPAVEWPTDTLNIAGDSNSYEKARSWRNLTMHTQPGWIDVMGAISLLGESSEVTEHFLANAKPAAGNSEKIRSVRISGLLRGAKNQVEMEVAEQTIKQIALGSRLFLYMTDAQIIDRNTYEVITIKVVNLGIFLSFDKLQKLNRTREFFETLSQQISSGNNLMDFFDAAGAAARAQARFAKIQRYYPGVSKVFDLARIDPAKTPIVDNNTTMLNDKTCSAMGLTTRINTMPERQQLRKASQNYDRAMRNKSTVETQFNAIEREIRSHTLNITEYKRKVAEIERYLADYKRQLDEYTNGLKNSQDTLDKVSMGNADQLKRLREAREMADKALKEVEVAHGDFIANAAKLTTNETPNPWFAQFEERGILVRSIRYVSPKIAGVIGVDRDQSIAYNPDSRLYEVTFVTTKPHIITVDPEDKGDAAEKIVGGPYEVKVMCDPLAGGITSTIRLATTDAVFGHHPNPPKASTIELFVHPHAKPITLPYAPSDLTGLTTTWAEVCLGEIQSTLFHCFKNNDARGVIITMMQWVICANSADKWGQNWVMFPPLDCVNAVAMGLVPATPKPAPVPDPDPEELVASGLLGDENIQVDLTQEELAALGI